MKIKGLGLIQILLVIALSAAIALAAVRYYSEIKISQKTTALWQQIVTITGAVEQCIPTLKPGQTVSSDAPATYCQTRDNLKKAGYLAEDSFENPWMGENSLGISQQGNSNVFRVWISADLIPSDICTNKLNPRIKQNYSITVGSTTYTGLAQVSGTACVINAYIMQ